MEENQIRGFIEATVKEHKILLISRKNYPHEATFYDGCISAIEAILEYFAEQVEDGQMLIDEMMDKVGV